MDIARGENMIQPRKEIEGLRPYIPGKPIDDVKKEFKLDRIIKLASNENPLGCSDLAKKAVNDFLTDPGFYPDGNCSTLRDLIAHKFDVLPEQLIFGAGSDEIISMITKTYVGPGDEVITCGPTFPQYKAGTLQMGGRIIELPLTPDFRFDVQGIVAAITPNTKVIFVANPNNPTGTIINADEQTYLLEQVPSHILVVMDEAYVEYIKEATYPDTLSMLPKYDNLMMLRTFSKMYGLAAFRIGYGVGSDQIIEKINRLRNPFNVSTPAQVAAAASLNDQAFIDRTFKENEAAKKYTYEQCESLGLNYIPSFGNFVMINFNRPSEEMFLDLQKRGFIVRPGHNLGMPGYQRVSLGTLEQMTAFFNTVQEILN